MDADRLTGFDRPYQFYLDLLGKLDTESADPAARFEVI
jgi:hypothetical protein